MAKPGGRGETSQVVKKPIGNGSRPPRKSYTPLTGARNASWGHLLIVRRWKGGSYDSGNKERESRKKDSGGGSAISQNRGSKKGGRESDQG